MSQFVLLLLLFFPATIGAAADNTSQSNSTKRLPSQVFGSSENPAQRFLDNLTDTNDANQNKAASSPPSTSVRSFGNQFLQDLFGWDLASKAPDQDSSESPDNADPIITGTTLTDSALHTHEDSFDDIHTTDDDLQVVDEIEQIDSDPIPIDIPSSISSTSGAPEDDIDDVISTKGSNANPTESSKSEADPSAAAPSKSESDPFAAAPRLVLVLNFDNVKAPGKNVLNMLKGIMSPRQKPQRAIRNARRTKNNSNHTKNNVDNDAANKPANINTDNGSQKPSAEGLVITRNGANDTDNQSLASNASSDTSGTGSDDKRRITSSNKEDNANHGNANHMNAPDSTASGGAASDADESSSTPEESASGGNDTNDGNGFFKGAIRTAHN